MRTLKCVGVEDRGRPEEPNHLHLNKLTTLRANNFLRDASNLKSDSETLAKSKSEYKFSDYPKILSKKRKLLYKKRIMSEKLPSRHNSAEGWGSRANFK